MLQPVHQTKQRQWQEVDPVGGASAEEGTQRLFLSLLHTTANAASRRQDGRSQMSADKKSLSRSCLCPLRTATQLIADTHRRCSTGCSLNHGEIEPNTSSRKSEWLPDDVGLGLGGFSMASIHATARFTPADCSRLLKGRSRRCSRRR